MMPGERKTSPGFLGGTIYDVHIGAIMLNHVEIGGGKILDLSFYVPG